MAAKEVKKFGTMAGVFAPTFLTILGVIMYIRLPWVVGNAGIIGTLAIIGISVAITGATAVSLSSITTNIRIGSGGAFSLISQSLGLEIGGAIGIPFYIAQAIAVAMYVFGFREGLETLLPQFSPLILDIMVFALVLAIAFISTSFAFKIQFVIMGIIIISIASIVGGLFVNELNYDFQWFGTYPGSKENGFSGSSFWLVFAVFFPAVTGVMAGANMSGDLENPRKSIPLGTLSAVLITTVVYVGLVFVAALLATPEGLVKDYNVFIDKAFYGPVVLAGLLGATLSSALGSYVGAPRILLALGEKKIIPMSGFWAKVTKKGEPINAMLFTAIVVMLGLSFRDLNAIAPLITMFFMITYGMVNVVALVEQSLALPSFRPTMKISIWIPFIGAIGSLTVMFIINALVALISLILIVVFYFYLVNKKLESEAGDSRSGLFTALSEWAMKKTINLSSSKEVRSWRPDLMIPVTNPKYIRSSFKMVESLVAPKGSVKLLAINSNDMDKIMVHKLDVFLKEMTTRLKKQNISASHSYVSGDELSDILKISMQSLNAAFFKPNTIFLSLDQNIENHEAYTRIIKVAMENSYGIILYVPFENVGLSLEKDITLWLKNLPSDWKKTYDLQNNDLAILLSLLIKKNWNGRLKVYITNNNGSTSIEEDLVYFSEVVRLPTDSQISYYKSEFELEMQTKDTSDIDIFTLDAEFDLSQLLQTVNHTRTSAIFCCDSGKENALV
jgi:amino acid transporter